MFHGNFEIRRFVWIKCRAIYYVPLLKEINKRWKPKLEINVQMPFTNLKYEQFNMRTRVRKDLRIL